MTTKIFNMAYYAICILAFAVSFVLSVKQHARQKNISKLQALYDELDKRVEDVVKATKNVNVAQNVDQTFHAGNDAQSTNSGLADAAGKADKTDGSVVIEIDKIKGKDKNGTNN